MRISAKLGLTALVAALLLSAAVSTASARNLSVSNQNIRATWNSLEFQGTVTVRCQVTLEGSFDARTIPKVLGTLIGVVTRAPVKTESCTNARASAENLPWHITYEGFEGILPRIEAIFILLREFLFRLANVLGVGINCRYGLATDNITGKATLNATQEALNIIPVTGRNTATLLEGPTEGIARCSPTGRMVGGAGEGAITLLNASTRIRITLI